MKRFLIIVIMLFIVFTHCQEQNLVEKKLEVLNIYKNSDKMQKIILLKTLLHTRDYKAKNEIQELQLKINKLQEQMNSCKVETLQEQISRLEELVQKVNEKINHIQQPNIPENIWNNCWNKEHEYFDFTNQHWMRLSIEKQKKYARKYQYWYAQKQSVLVETEFPGGGTLVVMVLIPPGKFWMGSPENEQGRFEDEKQHKVLIDQGFWMGKYEVTQKQWQDVMGENPSYFKNAGENAPVEKVSWNDCQKFCQKTGLSLPTEAQWEYACRAGTQGMSYEGNFAIQGENNAPQLGMLAWYTGNSGVNYVGGWNNSEWKEMEVPSKQSGTHPIGMKQSNSWKLYDMLGNVWEWCNDQYKFEHTDSVFTETKNIKNPHSTNRSLRGGCWGNDVRLIRAAMRYKYTPDKRNNGIGFRVCLVLKFCD